MHTPDRQSPLICDLAYDFRPNRKQVPIKQEFKPIRTDGLRDVCGVGDTAGGEAAG